MKVCEKCHDEISTKDGENLCNECEKEVRTKAKRAAANKRRRETAAVYRDCGLVKVRGALGGVYFE